MRPFCIEIIVCRVWYIWDPGSWVVGIFAGVRRLSAEIEAWYSKLIIELVGGVCGVGFG
jgi:hypothetical protein